MFQTTKTIRLNSLAAILSEITGCERGSESIIYILKELIDQEVVLENNKNYLIKDMEKYIRKNYSVEPNYNLYKDIDDLIRGHIYCKGGDYIRNYGEIQEVFAYQEEKLELLSQQMVNEIKRNNSDKEITRYFYLKQMNYNKNNMLSKKIDKLLNLPRIATCFEEEALAYTCFFA